MDDREIFFGQEKLERGRSKGRGGECQIREDRRGERREDGDLCCVCMYLAVCIYLYIYSLCVCI